MVGAEDGGGHGERMAEWPFPHVPSKSASGKNVDSCPRSLLGNSRSRGSPYGSHQEAGSGAGGINFIKPSE